MKNLITFNRCLLEIIDSQNAEVLRDWLTCIQSKYDKITDLSRTLQEDPSCQLLTVLRRYIHSVGVRAVEASLVDDTLPRSLTVKKGLLVLIRQWKNVLYMPMLADPGFKVFWFVLYSHTQ